MAIELVDHFSIDLKDNMIVPPLLYAGTTIGSTADVASDYISRNDRRPVGRYTVCSIWGNW